jgi:MFS family permease
MCLCGTGYAFSTYSAALREGFGGNVSPSRVQLIGTMINVGIWTSFPCGFFVQRFGTRSAMILAGLLFATGYTLMSMGRRIGASPELYACFAFVAGQGSGWLYLVVLQTTLANFPNDVRGKVVGVLVAFYGLSAALFTQVYDGFVDHDVDTFFLVMAITCGSVPILFSTIVVRSGWTETPQAREQLSRLTGAQAFTAVIIVYILVATLLEQLTSASPTLLAAGCFAVLALVCLLPIGMGALYVVPAAIEGKSAAGDASPNSSDVSDEEQRVSLQVASQLHDKLMDGESGVDSGGGDGADTAKPVALSVKETLQTLDFWLLWFIFLCCIGSGIMAINNQVGESCSVLSIIIASAINQTLTLTLIYPALLPSQTWCSPASPSPTERATRTSKR